MVDRNATVLEFRTELLERERAVAGTIVTARRVADTSGATMAHSSSANTSGTLADRTAMALWKNQFGDRSEVTEA